jgi:Cys-tRNA(Pro) deacylase
VRNGPASGSCGSSGTGTTGTTRSTSSGREKLIEKTPALTALDGSGLAFEVIETERATSAEESAEFQGIELRQLLRTIVIRRGENDYVFVLTPGGRNIEWGKLRKHLGVSRLSLPEKEEATQATGYERGAITPFGSTTAWPVIADASIEREEKVAIGGGGHGVNLHIRAGDLIDHLKADVVDVTKETTFS